MAYSSQIFDHLLTNLSFGQLLNCAIALRMSDVEAAAARVSNIDTSLPKLFLILSDILQYLYVLHNIDTKSPQIILNIVTYKAQGVNDSFQTGGGLCRAGVSAILMMMVGKRQSSTAFIQLGKHLERQWLMLT